MRTGCFGLCEVGPVVIIYPEGAFYSRIQPADVDEIVAEHLVKGRIVTRLLYKESVEPTGGVKALDEVDFYKKAKTRRASQLRRDQSGEHRRVHRL